MKKLLFLLCILATTLSYAKKWDAAYIAKMIAAGQIDKVIQHYEERYYGPNRDPQDAFKIAELYVKKKQYPTAMQWYDREKQLINTSKVNLFNYANTCRLVGEYQKALDGYLMYAAQTGDVEKVMDYANQCERVLKASALADNFKLENYTYNTPLDESGLTVLRNNPIYITTDPSVKDVKPVFTPFQIVRDFQNFAEPAGVLSSSNQQPYITGLSYTRDGNMVAYSSRETTVTSKTKPVSHDKIFIAENLGGSFLNVKMLPFNADGYSYSHPAFNSDGNIIYFASNIPGGYGGYDIWKSTLVNGSWSKPVNLGALLNSKADELNPFMLQDKKDNVLYFSSDREGGFGGFDIYAGKNIDNIWQDVEMQPAPINSPANEISVIYDNDINTGYVSSDRSGGKGGFDVYRFTPFNLRYIVNAVDSTGKVIDYALVQLNENGIKVNEGVTNEHGIAVFQIGKNKTFTINISKDGFRPISYTINSTGKSSGDSIVSPVELKADPRFSITSGATNNLSMDNYITFTGVVNDAMTGKPARYAKMRMVNYTTKKLREIDLDENGRFYIKLLMNNSYKVIFENQESKLSDELTTYGMEKYDVKVRDYMLTGNKLKIEENRVYQQTTVPGNIKAIIDQKLKEQAVLKSGIDTLVKTIAKEKATAKKSTTTSKPVASTKSTTVKTPAAKPVVAPPVTSPVTTPAKSAEFEKVISKEEKPAVNPTAPVQKITTETKAEAVKPVPAVKPKIKSDSILTKVTTVDIETDIETPVPVTIKKQEPQASAPAVTVSPPQKTKEVEYAEITPAKKETAVKEDIKPPVTEKTESTTTAKVEPKQSPSKPAVKKDTISLQEAIAIWREKVKKEGIIEAGAGIGDKAPKKVKVKQAEEKTTVINTTVPEPEEEASAAKPAPVIEKKPEVTVQQKTGPAVEQKPVQPAAKKETVARPDVYYKIQLGSYREDSITFPELKEFGEVERVHSYGQYVYRLGDFYNLDEAKVILDKVRMQGFYVAFVLQYNKEKVTAIVK